MGNARFEVDISSVISGSAASVAPMSAELQTQWNDFGIQIAMKTILSAWIYIVSK